MTHVESCPEFDEKGELVYKWFNQEGESVDSPDDIHKPPPGWRAQPVTAFKYVVGVDATCWMAEHAFRLAANVIPGMTIVKQRLGQGVNNIAAIIQLIQATMKPPEAEGAGEPS